MNLSENFTLEKLTYSTVAKNHNIDNTPTEQHIENLKRLCTNVLQPLYNKWNKPIIVNSGYRCEELNNKIKGSKTSQHLIGEAVDISSNNGKNDKLFECILKMIEKGEITVGQLIWEKGLKQPLWIHISLPTKNKKNEILYFH